MPRMVHKADLPSRTCVCCGRPFSWRRKWARVWADVRYCSARCRGTAPRGARAGQASQP